MIRLAFEGDASMLQRSMISGVSVLAAAVGLGACGSGTAQDRTMEVSIVGGGRVVGGINGFLDQTQTLAPPFAIDCPSRCSYTTAIYFNSLLLQPIARPGNRFVGWTGAGCTEHQTIPEIARATLPHSLTTHRCIATFASDDAGLPDDAGLADVAPPDAVTARDATLDVAAPDAEARDATVDATVDATDAASAADAGADASVTIGDASPTEGGVAVDATVARDVAEGDVFVAGPCGPRASGGACTPGAAGCDLVSVSLGSEAFSPGACAVFSDGSLRCWSAGCSSPGIVDGIDQVRSAVHGGNFLCVERDGASVGVWCRGANNDAQFGTRAPLLSPTFIATPLPRGALTLGGSSGLTRGASGVVTAWGRNQYGQLGDGTLEADSMMHGVAPHEVPLAASRQLALEPFNGWVACGVFAGGDVRCWGRNVGGHFGTARSTDAVSSTPILVPGIADARAVALGPRFVCAIRTNDELWCWGAGNDPRMGGASPSPSRVLDRVTQAVVGGGVACALRDDATVWCWGAASLVGNNGSSFVAAPEQVRGLRDVRAIYGGLSTVCARRGATGAELWCWGSLAPGSTTDGSTTPVRVAW